MVNFTPRLNFKQGDLVKCKVYFRGKSNPWDSAKMTGMILGPHEEALVLETHDNMDGMWIRLLSLDTQEAAWFNRWSFEKVDIT